MEGQPEATGVLDTTGKCCPMPIVELNHAMKELALGGVLMVIATDPGTRTDIPAWCNRTGNQLLATTERDGIYRYRVKRAR
jgi:tRNA 2-thiouridine synthesizing protein A